MYDTVARAQPAIKTQKAYTATAGSGFFASGGSK
jgi:hypothetical protein